MIAKNNYHWCKDIKDIDFIANGDIVEVKRLRKTQEMYGFRFARSDERRVGKECSRGCRAYGS